MRFVFIECFCFSDQQLTLLFVVIILLWNERVHGKSETRGAQSKKGDHEDYESIQMRRPKSDEFKTVMSDLANARTSCVEATKKLPKVSDCPECVTCKKVICITEGCRCNNDKKCTKCIAQGMSAEGRLL